MLDSRIVDFNGRFKPIDGKGRRARSDGKWRDFALYTEAHISETSLGGDEDDEEIEMIASV